MRKVNVIQVFMCVFCLVAVPENTGAFPVRHVSLAERVIQSHRIVVANATSVSHLSNNELPQNKTFDVEFAVERVIKGKKTEREVNLSISSPKISVGQRVLLFLTPQNGLFASGSFPGPVIIIGSNSHVHDTPPKESAFRSVLLYLAGGLVDDSTEVQSACLRNLRDIHPLLYVRHPKYGNAGELRKALEENELGLESFVEKRILPSVRKLLLKADVDPNSRDSAILVAGLLQDAEMIPRIAEISRRKDTGWVESASYVLGEFRTPKATRWLIPLLKDDLASIKNNSAKSLSIVGDPVAVPFFLECLNDSSIKVRRTVVTGLHSLTKESWQAGSWHYLKEYEEKEEQYISFWKKWAQEHADEMIERRRQSSSARLPEQPE